MPRKRIKIISISLICFFVLVVVLAIVFKQLFFPGIIEKRLETEFEKVGLLNVAVEISELSPWQAKLDRFSLGKKKRFLIREIRANFSPQSLMRRNIHSLQIIGASIDIKFKDGILDLGPFSNFQPSGTPGIPFKELNIEESELIIGLEDKTYRVPVAAKIWEKDDTNFMVELNGLFQDSPIILTGNYNSLSSELYGKFEFEEMQSHELPEILNSFLPVSKMKFEGRFGATGNFVFNRSGLKVEAVISSEEMILTPAVNDFSLPISLNDLKTEVTLTKNNAIRLHFKSNVNQSPSSATVTYDLQSQNGTIEFAIDDFEINRYEKILNKFLPIPVETNGKIHVRGNSNFNSVKGTIGAKIQTDKLLVSTEIQNRNLFLSTDSTKLKIDISREPFLLSEAVVTTQYIDIVDTSSGVSLNDITLTFPYSFSNQKITNGTFNLHSVAYKDFEFLESSGSFNFRNRKLDLQGSGGISENDTLQFSGWIDWNRSESVAEFQARIPHLNLNTEDLSNSPLHDFTKYELDGIASIHAQVNLQKGELIPYINLELKDIYTRNSLTKTEMAGINGIIKISDLFPLTSEGDQTITIDAIQSGNFYSTNGQIVFEINDKDSISIKQVEFDWLGGKLFCQNTKVSLNDKRFSFDLRVEGLDLQEILDFIQYDGVRGQGKIYGQLPITLEWGEQNRITFGNGFLEANPNKGVLQISEENAKTILGIADDIDPQSADLEETVSLLVFEALQDMEYTKLKIIFEYDEMDGLLTTIQAQGHGPRGDVENQIPIGGLNVNINNLDELINSLIYSNMSAGKIKLD